MITISKWSPLKIIRDKVKEEPLILAHHPFCERYSHHVVDIRGYKVCMGCLFAYPSALVIILFFRVPVFSHFFTYVQLFALGSALFLINAARKTILRDKLSQRTHIVFRIILGLSLGFVISSILSVPDLGIKILLLILTITVASLYNIANGLKTMKICKECSNYQDFPRCEGAYPDFVKDNKTNFEGNQGESVGRLP